MLLLYEFEDIGGYWNLEYISDVTTFFGQKRFVGASLLLYPFLLRQPENEREEYRK